MLLLKASQAGAGGQFVLKDKTKTFIVGSSGAGSYTASVIIDVSNDGKFWIPLTTAFNVSDLNPTDGIQLDSTATYHRARISALTGNCTVEVTYGPIGVCNG